MTPARFVLVRPYTPRKTALWCLRCSCGSVLAAGDTLDAIRERLVAEHRQQMPYCHHRDVGYRVVA